MSDIGLTPGDQLPELNIEQEKSKKALCDTVARLQESAEFDELTKVCLSHINSAIDHPVRDASIDYALQEACNLAYIRGIRYVLNKPQELRQLSKRLQSRIDDYVSQQEHKE